MPTHFTLNLHLKNLPEQNIALTVPVTDLGKPLVTILKENIQNFSLEFFSIAWDKVFSQIIIIDEETTVAEIFPHPGIVHDLDLYLRLQFFSIRNTQIDRWMSFNVTERPESTPIRPNTPEPRESEAGPSTPVVTNPSNHQQQIITKLEHELLDLIDFKLNDEQSIDLKSIIRTDTSQIDWDTYFQCIDEFIHANIADPLMVEQAELLIIRYVEIIAQTNAQPSIRDQKETYSDPVRVVSSLGFFQPSEKEASDSDRLSTAPHQSIEEEKHVSMDGVD